MRYINTLCEGETIRNVYLCKGKRSAETRNGKPYDNLILQDKTGTLDGKVWDPNSSGIADYDELDFFRFCPASSRPSRSPAETHILHVLSRIHPLCLADHRGSPCCSSPLTILLSVYNIAE